MQPRTYCCRTDKLTEPPNFNIFYQQFVVSGFVHETAVISLALVVVMRWWCHAVQVVAGRCGSFISERRRR